MSTEQEEAQAYEEYRLADLGAKGAEQYLEIALRDKDAARAKLEAILKRLPNRIQQ